MAVASQSKTGKSARSFAASSQNETAVAWENQKVEIIYRQTMERGELGGGQPPLPGEPEIKREEVRVASRVRKRHTLFGCPGAYLSLEFLLGHARP